MDLETTRRHPDVRPRCATSWSTAALRPAAQVACADMVRSDGWFGPMSGATLRPTQPSGRIPSREHRRSRHNRRRRTEPKLGRRSHSAADAGAGVSTPTTAAWRPDRRWTSSSTSTTRSRPARSPSTSRSRSASRRSTRRSAAACAPASCCSSAARRAPARRRWPSRWRATSPPAARPTCCTSASSTTSSTCSTGSSRWSRRSPTCPTRPARSRSRTSARRSSGPGWPRARRAPRWPTTRACARRSTGSRATARTCS